MSPLSGAGPPSLDAAGYVVAWLTGQPTMDSITADDYRLPGLDGPLPLPEPVEPLAIAGGLGPGPARALGLLEGTPVAAGTYDTYVVIGDPDLVGPALEVAGPGGRVVLFAGFGDRPQAVVDLNRLHYEEIVLVGSEWIGAPPNQRRERYGEALDLLVSGVVPVERLVTARCGLDGIEDAFEAQRERRGLKTILLPGA